MKARIPIVCISEADVRKTVQAEYDRLYQEHQANIQRSIAVQLTAAFLHTMHTTFGYGKDRLRKLFSALSWTFEDMDGVGFAKPYNCGDLIDWCKEYAGIDLDKEIQTEIK